MVWLLGFAIAPVAQADLSQRVNELEKRVQELEWQMREITDKERWKKPATWSRLKKGMPANDVRTLLGIPARTEQRVFTTWYYHATSKLHSFVWFDDDRVLGWTAPED